MAASLTSQRAAGSLPGVGDATSGIQNPTLKQHRTVHTFAWYMTKYGGDTDRMLTGSAEALERWRGDAQYGQLSRLGAPGREKKHVSFIDLNNRIAEWYDVSEEAAVEPLFADPHTHISLVGAEINADEVIQRLKLLHPDPGGDTFWAKDAAVQP